MAMVFYLVLMMMGEKLRYGLLRDEQPATGIDISYTV